MLNKEQYDILSLIKTHNVTNPITAIDIVNRPFYGDFPNPLLTDDYLKILFDSGYIETNDPAGPKYFCGYTGYVYITSSGYTALNDYEYQTRLSNSIAELRHIADTAKEQASAARQQAQAANEKLQIAKEQVGMAKLDAKWSKTFAIVSIAISVFSLAIAFAGFVFTHLI